MSTRNIGSVGRFLILPALYAGLVAADIFAHGHAINRWLPGWHTMLVLGALIAVERIYTYQNAVSQRSVLGRDIASTLANIYVTGAVTTMIVLPLLVFFPEHFLGRKLLFASPGQLGPVWLQLAVIFLLVSFFRYWIHRLQHSNGFLWKLHSYHHRVTDLQAMNDLVSNPIDFALRNVLIYVVLGIVGFDATALLFAGSIMGVVGVASHCGGDVKGGPLNYLFVTPEVHRWHHTAEVPDGYGYSVNYGVEFSFWDILFGSYYLPQKEGRTLQPERIGHPDGLADESSYLRIVLIPVGLYGIVPWLRRVLRIPGAREGQQSA
jgi:sterol desaturase/sphingolipid hydroxylase (fatty acid hydroxylase superfamily)